MSESSAAPRGQTQRPVCICSSVNSNHFSCKELLSAHTLCFRCNTEKKKRAGADRNEGNVVKPSCSEWLHRAETQRSALRCLCGLALKAFLFVSLSEGKKQGEKNPWVFCLFSQEGVWRVETFYSRSIKVKGRQVDGFFWFSHKESRLVLKAETCLLHASLNKKMKSKEIGFIS